MPPQRRLITDFSAGELSPRMAGRVDLPYHEHGAEQLENWIPFIQGGVTTRPGLQYRGDIKTGSVSGVRLLPFNVSNSVSFVLEMGITGSGPTVGYLRIWSRSSTGALSLVMDGASPLEFLSSDDPVLFPWTTIAAIREIQYAQDGAELYLVQGSVPPRKLVYSSGSFSLSELTVNGNLNQMPPSGSGNYPRAVAIWGGRLWFGGSTNDPQRIWASEPYCFKATTLRTVGYDNWYYYDTVSTTTTQAKGLAWKITGSLVNGQSFIADIAASDMIKLSIGDIVISSGLRGPAGNGSEITSIGTYYAEISNTPTATGTGTFYCNDINFTAGYGILDNILTGISAINASKLRAGDVVVGPSLPAGTTIVSISTSTAGTADSANATVTQEISCSPADPDYPEFYEETTWQDVTSDASAIDALLGSDQLEEVLWMAAGRDLVIGCSTSEFVVPAGVTALTMQAKLQTRYGSAPIQGRFIGQAVTFLQRGATQAREYFYFDENAAYKSPDLTFHAEHILSSGVREIDFAQTPQPMVFCLREDGDLAVLVYSREYGAQAWCRFVGAGADIESIAVINGEAGDDIIYVAVNRGTSWTIESFDPLLAPECNLDSWAEIAKGSTNTVARFAGLPVVAIYEGVAYSCGTANGSGTFAIPAAVPNAQNAYVGLAYTCSGRSTRARVLSQADSGYTTIRRATKAILMLLASYEFEIASVAGWEQVQLPKDENGDELVPYTGDAEVFIPGEWSSNATIAFRQTEPWPVTILAIAPEIT